MAANKKKKVIPKQLTPEQRLKLLLTPCKTREELRQWVKYFLELELPSETVSRHATTNPLSVVWQVYDICVNKNNPNNYQEILYVASRGSGKTLGAAIAEFMIMLHDQRDVAHVGAILQQAKRAYEYVQSFCVKPNVKDILDPPGVPDSQKILQKNTMERSVFNVNGQMVSMEVLPTTMKALNGVHCIGGKTKILVDNSNNTFPSKRSRLNISASKLHDLVQAGNPIKVISFNEATKVFESKSVIASINNGKKSRLKIEHSANGTPLWCTPEHKILDPVSWTWQEANTFKVGSQVLVPKRSKLKNTGLLVRKLNNKIEPRGPDSFDQVLLGSLLGDGGVYKRWEGSSGAVYMENHGLAQKEYLLWKKEILSQDLSFYSNRDSKSGFSGDIGLRITSKASSNLLDLASFKKDMPFEMLSKLDRQALAVWYMDDGHHDYFCTHSFSIENLQKLQLAVKTNFDINLKIWGKKESNGSTYSLLRFATQLDYAKFYALTYEYAHPTMRYKWDAFTGVYNCLTCGSSEFRVNTSNMANQCVSCLNKENGNWKTDTIKAITPIPQKRDVFDFEVADNHNFVAGGMVVHNCSLVSCDELDTLNGEGLRAIKEVAGMLDTKKGKKPLRIGISTRKSKSGLMHKMMENAEKEGRHIECWTALEFTERCPDERSGVIPTDYYINVDKGEVVTPEEYARLDGSRKKDFFLDQGMYDKCKTCPVAVYCRGDAKKQVSKSNMLKTIDELNQKIRSEGHEWAASQLFNLKPSSEGIIFKEFDENVHIKSWNEMWLILTGKEFPGDCTHDLFVKKCHEMGLACYGGIDWGWSNPHTVVYLFVDQKENVYVVRCEGMTYISQPMWIHQLKTKYHNKYRCQLYAPDQADKGAVLEMQKAGLPVANDAQKPEIIASIQTVKKFLRVPGMPQPKLFLARETTAPLVHEFGTYHFKVNAAGVLTDEPDDADNHWIDALRYIMTVLFGKNTIVLGDGLGFNSMDGLQDRQGLFQRMPTPQEYAITQGIRLNPNPPDLTTLGKIGTAKDLDQEEEMDSDGTSSGSSGSFLWNF